MGLVALLFGVVLHLFFFLTLLVKERAIVEEKTVITIYMILL